MRSREWIPRLRALVLPARMTRIKREAFSGCLVAQCGTVELFGKW